MEHKKDYTDLDSSTKLIKNAAEKRGIAFKPVIFYSDEVEHEIYSLTLGENTHLLDITSPDNTSSIANTISDNKYLTHIMLDELEAPSANYAIFNELQEALAYFKSCNYSCVLKPVKGGGGDGVCIDINNEEDFKSCFLYSQSFYPYVLVEEYLPGSDTRFLVIDYKVAAISQREPAYIIGDGIKDVKTLIDETNQARSEGRKGNLSKIKIDKICLDFLKKENISFESVPPKDQKVYVRPNANLNTGGQSTNIDAAQVHPDNCKLVEKIAKRIGLSVAGIDVLTTDISKPLVETKGFVVEVNDRPRIRMHEKPSQGVPVNASDKIITMLFPESVDNL